MRDNWFLEVACEWVSSSRSDSSEAEEVRENIWGGGTGVWEVCIICVLFLSRAAAIDD